MEKQPHEQTREPKMPVNAGKAGMPTEPQEEEQPVQNIHKFPYRGTVAELLNTSTYTHNKNIPLWEYKDLHIGEHHKMSHLDLNYAQHKGSIHDILTGQKSPEGAIERDDTGSPIPVDMSVYSVKGKYPTKQKSRKLKSHKKPFKTSPFKGI